MFQGHKSLMAMGVSSTDEADGVKEVLVEQRLREGSYSYCRMG